MDKLQSFQEFLAQQSAPVDLPSLGLGLAVALVLGAALAAFYRRFGTALGNRARFARNLMPLAATTMVVIAMVKTSLALSLGLVGALSIVRFRAAIKEPEELVYLFLAIAIGLGCGASQIGITFVAVLAILGALFVRHRLTPSSSSAMLLFVRASGDELPSADKLLETVAGKVPLATLKRLDRSAARLDAMFAVEVKDQEQLVGATDALLAIAPGGEVSFLDARDETLDV